MASVGSVMKAARYLGKSPDDLSITDRRLLAGKWIAQLRYTPANLALRRIEALADTPSECIRELRAAGKDLAQYEFVQLKTAG